MFVGGERSVRRTLVVRAGIVVALFLIVIVVFWLDRDGLRDHADGSISFVDVVYFTMVSVTTVGYGDIVPVTRQARLVDAVLVTPIRLFIWLIFIGTAYQLVLQRLIEDFRMRRLQARLQDHILVVGYGHSGQCAAAELVARGFDKSRVLIIDVDHARLEQAAEHGYVGILGDASREETLREAMLSSAQALLVCTDRDDTNVLITLTARHLSPHIPDRCSRRGGRERQALAAERRQFDRVALARRRYSHGRLCRISTPGDVCDGPYQLRAAK